MRRKALSAIVASVTFVSATEGHAKDFGAAIGDLAVKGGNKIGNASLSVIPRNPAIGIGGLAVGAVPGAAQRVLKNGTDPMTAFAEQVGEISSGKGGNAIGASMGKGALSKLALGAAGKKIGSDVFNSFLDRDASDIRGGIQDASANNDGLWGKSGITQYNLNTSKFSFGGSGNTPTPRAQRFPDNNDRVLIGGVPNSGGNEILGQIVQGVLLGVVNGTVGGGYQTGNDGAPRGNQGQRQFYSCPNPPC